MKYRMKLLNLIFVLFAFPGEAQRSRMVKKVLGVNMKYISLFAAFLLLSSSIVFAQELTPQQNAPSSLFSFPSTLPLNNLKMSQSISFSTTYNSGTKSAYYLSNFCSSFKLPLSEKLKLALDLNFVNYGKFGSSSPLISNENTKILPNFSLDYAPTENLRFRIEYQSFPTYYHSFR